MNFVREPAVAVEELRAGYGGEDVLKNVSIAFRRGETFVLLGPNGAGKSTLIRVLTGALAPSAGALRFSRGRRAVGLAPQQIALYPWLTPRENCLAFGRLSGLSRPACEARLGEVLALTGCEPAARTPVSRLSGGYQRRANIAAALMNDPELVILDEPTAGLDAEGRAHVAATVAAVQAAGAALLLVTHDFDFAERVASQVGVLVGGALVCAGPPAELLAARLGPGERIDFVLKDAPDAAARAKLLALGAEPEPGGRAFRFAPPRARLSARAAAEAVEATGLRLGEWRARPAGLEELFAAAIAQETAT